jgi:predicted nucleic acid-binding protein
MIVVSDTTALTTLIKSGFEDVLPRLFGQILIPSAVSRELLMFHPTLPEWCVVREATASPLLERLRLAVDPGEAEAIALAHEFQAEVVLLDDKWGAGKPSPSASPALRCPPCWSSRREWD